MQTNQHGMLLQIAAHRSAFACMFVALFAVTFGFLSMVGATPDHAGAVATDSTSTPIGVGQSTARASSATVLPATNTSKELPVRVVAKDIGVNASVSNPTSTDINILDRAAFSGAVRYPTSAKLGEDGTMILFGHSSYLPVVHNQAYKTFNDVQNLKKGSFISVYSATTEYRYSVVGVEVANATRDVVELKPVGKHLTVVTCDSFLTKSNRFIVTADFVGAYSLSQ